MDVEAQDDGIMGKILVQDGAKAVPVGKLIALLAEEGDDISNLVVPAEAESSSSKPAETSSEPSPPSPPPSGASSSTTTPSTGKIQDSHGEVGAHPHSKLPLFPSVIRLLQDHNLSADVDSLGIKGTGEEECSPRVTFWHILGWHLTRMGHTRLLLRSRKRKGMPLRKNLRKRH